MQPKVLVIGMFMCLCVHKGGGQKTHKVTVFLQNTTFKEKQSHFCRMAFLLPFLDDDAVTKYFLNSFRSLLLGTLGIFPSLIDDLLHD